MAAKDLRVDRRIQWDGESSRILSPSLHVNVEVVGKPDSGFGFLLLSHPSDQRRDIRFYVDRTEGAIVGTYANQQVVSGSYIQLFPDAKNPRPEEWVVFLSLATIQIKEDESDE